MMRLMRNTTFTRATAAAVTGMILLPAAVTGPAAAETGHRDLELTFLGRHTTGTVAAGASEITAYDARTRRVFVVNAQAGTLDVLDIRDPRTPRKVATLATPEPTASRSTTAWSPSPSRPPSRPSPAPWPSSAPPPGRRSRK
nr:hypothetical protein GCM10020093_047850 [Planobispora longispora]